MNLRLVSDRASVTDFNPSKPALDLAVSSSASGGRGLEKSYFPAGHSERKEGRRLAELELGREAANKEVGRGESDIVRLASGHRFVLTGHRHDKLNKEYLAIKVEHGGEYPLDSDARRGPLYRNRFSCVDASVVHRPPKTDKPLAGGIETAIVTGPSGQSVHTDELGRVKVRFHWDEQSRSEPSLAIGAGPSRRVAGE